MRWGAVGLEIVQSLIARFPKCYVGQGLTQPVFFFGFGSLGFGPGPKVVLAVPLPLKLELVTPFAA
jgi:hypothetical protein